MSADGHIDILFLDEVFETITEMNVSELVQYKLFIIELEIKLKLFPSYKSSKNDKLYKIFDKDLCETYDSENAKNDIIREELRLKKVQQRKLFNSIVLKNNQFYLKHKNELIERIDIVINEKKTFCHKDYMNQRIKCDCGAESIRKNMSRHLKSAIHLKNSI